MTTSQAILSGDNRASNFALNEEQQAVLDQADRFARKELYPLSERVDREEWWPDEAFRVIGDNGFFGATIPEEYGGAGLDLLAAGLVLQGFARWNHAMALSWVAHDNLCANNIYRNGNEQQRRKYLPDLCTAGKSAPWASPNRAPAPTRWDRCAPLRGAMGIITSSTEARSTSPMDLSPTSSWSTPRPIVQKARRAFPPSSSKRAFPDSRSHRN